MVFLKPTLIRLFTWCRGRFQWVEIGIKISGEKVAILYPFLYDIIDNLLAYSCFSHYNYKETFLYIKKTLIIYIAMRYIVHCIYDSYGHIY